MTWSHYNAELIDINGREAHACVSCDKHTPRMISAKLSFKQPDGTYGYSVITSHAANNSEGERYLVSRIMKHAAEHGLKITSEKFTEFTNIKQKESNEMPIQIPAPITSGDGWLSC